MQIKNFGQMDGEWVGESTTNIVRILNNLLRVS